MNKKGLVLRNILELIFVIISLGVIMSCGGKVVKVIQGNSDKVDSSFTNFVDSIHSLKKSHNVGEIANPSLSLEEGMAVVYYEPYKKSMEVKVSLDTSANYFIHFTRPKNCKEENSCLCLIKEKDIQDKKLETDTFQGSYSITINPIKPKCDDELDVSLTLDNCGIGVAKGVQSYACKYGFVIERLLIKEAHDQIAPVEAYYETNSHLALQLTKEADSISISPQ